MKTTIKPVWALLLLLAIGRSFGLARNINGTVAGLVRDTNGALIANARIVLVQSDRQTRREAVSDGTGQFRLTGLPPGQYELEVTATGFATYKRETLAVLVGDSAFLNVTLQAGGVNEVVTIAGQPDDISRARSSGSRGSSLTEREMTDLPTLSGNVSRSYRAQVFLLPGVTPARAAHSPFSSYHSWQSSLRGRITNGLSVRAAYSLLSGTETPDGSLVNRINDVGGTLARDPGSFIGFRPADGLTLATLRTAVIPARGTIGTPGRNTETGDSYFDVSAGLHKDFAITERFKTQFRVEVFNLFNQVNYDAYVNNIADARFGQASAASPARAIQLALRFTF